MYVDKLRRKIVSYAHASALSAKNAADFATDVAIAFPRTRKVGVPRRILKPLIREADRLAGDPPIDIAIDNVDDETWNEMLDAYMSDYVPVTRAPEFVVDTAGANVTDLTTQADGTKVWYAWELEKDLTHEFVQNVRDGQIDAANDNGITDFVVISIIDDKTCDACCGDYGCVDFDGMLVSEIDDMTAGEFTTPPYHFNCRCTLAPATDAIPEKPDDGSKDFEDWLNT
jgi:hypothetical protein